jgi:hypothetical protein
VAVRRVVLRLESGDQPEVLGDQQGDQVPELLSAQLDPAAEVVNEPDAALLGAVVVDHDFRNRVVSGHQPEAFGVNVTVSRAVRLPGPDPVIPISGTTDRRPGVVQPGGLGFLTCFGPRKPATSVIELMGVVVTREFPGWETNVLGTMTLTITIAGEEIRLATVTYDDETGLYETYIGLPMTAHQLGRIDASRERAVRKAEDFLTDKLRRLL